MDIYNPDVVSSSAIFDEIKIKIHINFSTQDNFAKHLGYSRKALSRLLNHSYDFKEIVKICKLLGIKEILID